MSEAPKRIWAVHEFKIWKGLDKENPCWASLGFACSTWADADSLMQYIEGNKPTAILRVAPHTRADLSETDEQAFANEKVKALVEASTYLAKEMSFLLRTKPKYDGGLYRDALTKTQTALAAMKETDDD